MSLIEIKGILSFSIYKEILPIITDLLKFLIIIEKNSENKDYLFLLQETKYNLINILTFLSKGYNQYFSKPKSIYYNYVRDSLSLVQSNLILLNELNIISKESCLSYYNRLEDKMKMFVGLIKKIENKGVQNVK